MRKKKTEVRILKSILVATFGGANPPLIWKFDLGRNHSFTLALQGDHEGGEEGEWELGVTSPKGEFYPIARFLSRDAADEAFASLQQALTASQRPLVKKIFRLIIMAGLAFFGFMILMDILRTLAIHNAMQDSVMVRPAVQTPPAEMKTGVPQPADEVLQPPH